MSSGPSSDQAAAAAAALAAIPPLDKMSLVAIWVETLLYGINIVMYLGAAYVLVGNGKRRGPTIVPYALLIASTLLFTLSTGHVAVSLRQLLQAFTNPAVTSVPKGSSLYFLNQTDPLVFAGQALYLFNVLVQDLVLIWRLYAVFNSDWRVPILPLILEVINQVTALYSIVKFFHGTALEDPVLRKYGILSWSLHLIINIGVTAAIAAKIWWHGRRTVTIRGHNAYAGVAFTIMESGGLFAGATFVLYVFFINTSTGTDALVGVSPVTQLATLSPLLIIARVGFGLTHSGGRSQLSSGRVAPSHNEAVHVNITRSQVSDYASGDLYPMQAVKSEATMDA